jgi:hypothetical protein
LPVHACHVSAAYPEEGDNYGEGPDAKFLLKLSSLLSQLTERDRDVFLGLAKELAAR